MAVIHVLDKHTAELIAAGEVVERPASVVKELLENSIDAGAKQITVSIVRGGVAQIEVSDNGSGIEVEYIATAFIRHATSKISCQQDLESIGTLGFRGEALASIASVARIQLVTCTPQDEFAYCYRIEGGEEIGIEPAARPVGTTITVSDLFYNTPARMKFLKKDSSEGTFVAETIQRIALSHPEVSIAFIREGKQQFRTPGTGKLMDTIYTVLGREFSKELLSVESQSGAYQVKGWITPPRCCRASRAKQYFYINGRFVKNKTMMAALETAYKGTVMQGKFPGCVLELQLPPELVDVNVHPAKIEVRFAHEQDVFDAVYKGVKLALSVPQASQKQLEFSTKPQPEHKQMQMPSISVPPQTSVIPKQETIILAKQQPTLSQITPNVSTKEEIRQEKYVITTRNPKAFSGLCSSSLPYTVHHKEPDLDVMVEEDDSFPVVEQPAAETELPTQEEVVPSQMELVSQEEENKGSAPLQIVGEMFGTYILAQRGQEMCFIDKHAAHERILYEKLKNQQMADGQLLMEPVSVQLSAEQKNAVLQQADLLEQQGIQLEDFGGSTVLVRTVPLDISPSEVEPLVGELASNLVLNNRQSRTEKAEWVLHSIACRAAVKAGDHNSTEELLHLAQQILEGEIPLFCPHGRPVILKLTQKELEKQFGRQG